MATRLAVISPHLDDAVFGAGELIAAHPGAVVITAFAGVPPGDALTGWDRDCGFSGSREAMFTRRREDVEALQLLGATPCWLAFCDAQYAPSPDESAVRAALALELERHSPDLVAFPLGLFHSDHQLVSRAAQDLVEAGRIWLAPEDALYRRAARAAGGPPPRTAAPRGLAGRKARAVGTPAAARCRGSAPRGARQVRAHG